MKVILKTIVIAIAIYSSSAMALTAQECKDKGGSWKQTFGTSGMCTFDVTKVKINPADGPGNITAQECKDLGGTIGADGKCRVATKNLVNTNPKSNSSN